MSSSLTPILSASLISFVSLGCASAHKAASASNPTILSYAAYKRVWSTISPTNPLYVKLHTGDLLLDGTSLLRLSPNEEAAYFLRLGEPTPLKVGVTQWITKGAFGGKQVYAIDRRSSSVVVCDSVTVIAD